MNYELALKLKEAGFPVKWYVDNSGYDLPTLSELIEECGEGFKFSLHRFIEGWFADTKGHEGKGSTPEEAVANLWLELNK